MVAVYIVLKEACDTVQLLLKKTTKMSLRGTCGRLLGTYSEGRKHYTNLNEKDSKTTTLSAEVAQGSVLGPYYICYMYVHSPQYAGIKFQYFMFADDTVLVFPGPDLKELKKEINCDLKLYY